MNTLRILKVRNVKTPHYENNNDSGLNFYIPNDFNNGRRFLLQPHTDIIIHSGIKLQLPNNYHMLLVNGSGICYYKKLIIGDNIISNNYNKEIILHLINHSNSGVFIRPGDKIVKGVLIPHYQPNIVIN